MIDKDESLPQKLMVPDSIAWTVKRFPCEVECRPRGCRFPLVAMVSNTTKIGQNRDPAVARTPPKISPRLSPHPNPSFDSPLVNISF